MAMLEPNELSNGLPLSLPASHMPLGKKIMADDESDTPFSKTFTIRDEDHTIGNALRYMLMKDPNVDFCGYSIPHPSEYKINVRIQTNGNVTAVQALKTALDNLIEMANHIRVTFHQRLQDYPGFDEMD